MEEKLVIVIEHGIVTDIYSPDANLKIVIIDIDAKKCGDNFITEHTWPDTQFDDEKVEELLS